MAKYKLPNLDIDIIKHPDDSTILDGLNQIPLFKRFLNNTIVPIKESYNEVESYGDGWNITAQSSPQIYQCLKEACGILGVKKVPKLTSEWFYAPTSFSAGNENFRIVISSGAIDLFEKEELIFFLGHELGHYILYFKEKNFKGLYVHLDSKNECLDAEDSADYFATSLLMPMNSFVENYNRLQEAKMYTSKRE